MTTTQIDHDRRVTISSNGRTVSIQIQQLGGGNKYYPSQAITIPADKRDALIEGLLSLK